MKICFVGKEFNIFSGTSKPLYDLAKALTQMGVDVIFLTTGLNSKLKESHLNLIQQSVELKIVSSLNYRKAKKNGEIDIINKLLSESDLVHGFDFLSLYEMKVFLNKLDLKLPIIYSATGSYKFGLKELKEAGALSFFNMSKISFLSKFLFPKFGFRKIFNNFDKILVNTEFVKKEIETMGISKEKITFVPVGLNIDYLDSFNVKSPKIYDFVYFGWGSSIRGVPDIINAFEKVLKHDPNLKLGIFFLGSHGIEEDIYSYIISRKSECGYSIDLEVGAKQNMYEIIKSSKSIILPFRSHMGYSHPPLTILESMMLKKPVISTYVGSIPELISDGENGYLTNPKNPNELAKKMLMVLNGDNRDIARNARDYVIKNHNIMDVARKTLQIYRNILVIK